MPFGRIAVGRRAAASARSTAGRWSIGPVTAEFEPPYAPAIITLDEGYQMLTNVVGMAPEDLAIGMRVRVQFHAVGPDVTLPYFTGQK